MDRGITFTQHIAHIVKKSKRNLGFIIRNAGNFKKIQTLMILYFNLVRSNLEFGFLIWNPSHSSASSKGLEQIQKRFLKYLYYKTFQYYPTEIGYRELLQGFEILSLDRRRSIASLLFLYDIIREKIRNSDMLTKVNINVPRINSRYKSTFCPPPHPTHKCTQT